MVFSKSTALELCALNKAAYVLATTGTCTLPAGFSPPIPIRMPHEDRPFFLRSDPLDIWGFTATRGETLHIVFRGTQITSGWAFAQEWAEDALSLPLQPFGAGRVHPGFYGAWNALRPSVSMQSTTRIITGHSLGAAIATLCWAEFGGDLMTFASPRVGDSAFAKSLWDGQTLRIINQPDIVPCIPTDPPFRHGGFEQMVNAPGPAHALTSYIAGLQAL